MKKFNYNEPEFKVVKMASQDVLTASLDTELDTWDTKTGAESVDLNDIFSV